jgi:predicted ATPase
MNKIASLLLLLLSVAHLHSATEEHPVVAWVDRCMEGKMVSAGASDAPWWYIMTGGVGVGKTTLIKYLAATGQAVVEEAAAAYILSAQARGIEKPWEFDDLSKNIAIWIQRDVKRVKLEGPKLCFWDRGPFDPLLYSFHDDQEPCAEILTYAHQAIAECLFRPTVFILAELPVYENTVYRPESLDASRSIHACMEAGYRALGFNVVIVPPVSVHDRAEFILNHIAKEQAAAGGLRA